MKRNLAELDTDMFTPIGRLLQQGMAHGITNPMIFDGLVTGQTVMQSLRTIQTTKNCVLGSRQVTKDGRVFKYGLSSEQCRAGRGVLFWNSMIQGFDYDNISGTFLVGATEITMATGTHPAFEADELEGGYILISDDEAGGAVDADPQNRRIAGNDASLEDAALTLTLDTPLSRAISVTTQAFLMPNPWSSLRCGELQPSGSCGFSSHAGVPAAYVALTGYYFWTQTWGPLWCAMQGAVGKTEGERQVCFRWDGSIGNCTDDDATEEYQQRCGFIIDQTAADIGATFIMLQVGV